MIRWELVVLVSALASGLMWMVMDWRAGKRGKQVLEGADTVADAVSASVVEAFGDRLEKLRDVEALSERKLTLEAEVAQLRKEKGEIETDFNRQERELHHAAGLLRKELEAELARVRAEASHDADKRVLEVERDFGKKQMEFAEERFKGELETLGKLVETLTERLPDVSARINLKGEA